MGVTRVTARSVPCHRADDAGTRNVATDCGHFTDTTIGRICNVQVARTVQYYIGRILNIRTAGGTPVAAVTGGSGSDHGADDAGRRRNFTDTVIVFICDIDIARTVHASTDRVIQGRTGSGTPVARVRWRSGSGDGDDDPGSHRHFTDTVLRKIRQIQVARTVQGEHINRPDLCTGRWSTVTGGTIRSGSGHGRDDAGSCRDFTHAEVGGVRNVNITRPVQTHTRWTLQGRQGGESTVTRKAC